MVCRISWTRIHHPTSLLIRGILLKHRLSNSFQGTVLTPKQYRSIYKGTQSYTIRIISRYTVLYNAGEIYVTWLVKICELIDPLLLILKNIYLILFDNILEMINIFGLLKSSLMKGVLVENIKDFKLSCNLLKFPLKTRENLRK